MLLSLVRKLLLFDFNNLGGGSDVNGYRMDSNDSQSVSIEVLSVYIRDFDFVCLE